MSVLNSEVAAKLQKILSKRFKRELTSAELEQAYDALMGFAEELINLGSLETANVPKVSHNAINNPKYFVAINKHINV